MAIRAKDVMHRDLKTANILMHFPQIRREQLFDPVFNKKDWIRNASIVPSPGTDLPAVPFQVKIADLGFARKLRQDQLAATFLGTPLMMAPEILEKENYDHTADVWSLGCVFYEMMTGFPPFTGNNLPDLQNNI